jgi:hypothetical protein
MTTPTATPTRSTSERRVAKLFGLEGENWTRHANPWSVWTRFAVLPLIALAIWSRDWIGWWCLVPIVLSLVFMMVNPLLFPKPRTTRHWTSKSVFGERVWSERTTVPVPAQFTTKPLTVTYVFQAAGAALLAYGLVRLNVIDTVAGILILQVAKAWYLDRQVLLYEEMKGRHAQYATWEY